VVEAMDSFHGVILAVVFTDSICDFVDGSAVLVAPGIALCAWHVVEPRISATMAGHVHLHCLGVTPSGSRLWHVRKVTHVPETDVAILGLSLASEISAGATLHQAYLTTRFPKVGERLTIYGFRAAAETFPRGDGGATDVAG